MEKKHQNSFIDTNKTVLCAAMLEAPRLTPTGKISHAKTRVYTQRYRKEWEQMPDFKGWLTSVPFQPTRAFCNYCTKNLHAHRLSLLKHTCTMKHQRAALVHQNEVNAKQAAAEKIAEMEAGFDGDDIEEVQTDPTKDMEHDVDEDNEDFEYVVERLDMDEDDMDNSHCKSDAADLQHSISHSQDDEEYDGSTDLHCSLDEDDPITLNKKIIKIERNEVNCRDTLAEAMAHVHGEYLDGTDEQGNVEMEMVVESEEGILQDDREIESENCVGIDDDDVTESQNIDRRRVRRCIGGDKSSADGDSSDVTSGSELEPTRIKRKIDKSYQLGSSKIALTGSQPPYGNTVAIPTGQNQTFTLSSGKTVTLKSGTQYVLGKVRGSNVTTVLVSDRNTGSQSDVSTKLDQASENVSQQHAYAAVAGTSQQYSNQKQISSRSGSTTSKPCISTHVLDTSKGLPVGGLQVSLYKLMDGRWTFLNESNTSPNGRCNDLVDNSKCNFTAGRYKMHFDVDKYFTLRRIETMYPFIEIVFDVKNPTGNYHIPVLLSPFGYTTYRGSDR